jgi:cytoskeletal protein CcmA (bactofilin family)
MLEVKRKPASHSHGATAPSRAYSDQTHEGQVGVTSSPNISTQLRPVAPATERDLKAFQAKLPVIIGEVHFKGSLSADGILVGHIGSGNGLSVKQRTTSGSQPELVGDVNFKDMIRVNGHIAGSVYSKAGTMIVDTEAKVDANVDVAVAMIGGTVSGDIVARERVELGPTSKIYGNIWTRSIVIKDGAIFEGVCRMIEEEKAS